MNPFKAIRFIFRTATFCALGTLAANASTIIDLGNLGGGSSQGSGINNSGEVVGTSTGGAFNIPFAWVGNNLVNLGNLGGSGGAAFQVNDAGQVAGYSATPGGYAHAFLDTPGVGMIHLGTLGGSSSGANGINQLGQVAGYADTAGGVRTAFVYTPGTGMTSLGLFGGVSSTAYDVNNVGQVVGYTVRSSGTTAFLYTPGTGGTDIGILGQGTSSIALAINDAGVAVGYSNFDATGAYHAIVYNPGSGLTDLGTLGGSSSFAYGINELGQIVGSASIGATSHAFIYSGGVMTDLNTLLPAASGWQLLTATGINDHGQITGTGLNPEGQRNAYLLDISSFDTPEPGTMWLTAGIVGLAGLLRKRGITK